MHSGLHSILGYMKARRPFRVIAAVCVVLLVIVGLAVYSIHKRVHEHAMWHECRDNCWLIDDAKRICADQRHLTNGTIVTWQNIQPYFTDSQYWGVRHLSTTGIPQCPSGGTYTIGPIGSWSMCSIPYHQWNNSKSKDGDLWRN
jgi:hypothetical protein